MFKKISGRTPALNRLFALVTVVFLGTLVAGCLGSGATSSSDASTPTFDASSPVLVPDSAPFGDDGGAPFAADAGGDASSPLFPVGGQVTGLSGSGLTLQDDVGDQLSIAASGAFVFPTLYASGASFSVSVTAQPTGPAQTCTASGATGTVAGPVTSVLIVCTTSAFPVGGQVVGLAGAGDAGASGTGLVLGNPLPDGGSDKVTISQNGSFAFPTEVPSGASYDITIASQPTSPAQTCNVSGGTGTVVSGAVSSAVVNCATNTYVIGGQVTGLSGVGLVLSNGTNSASVNANGSFAFSQPIPSGGSYAVKVATQPSNPSQTCTVTNGSGSVKSSNVTSVDVTCKTSTFAIGGSVTGLSGAGLTLASSTGEKLAVGKSGLFTFTTPVASGAPFSVTVATQPTNPWQTCTVTGGTGTVANGPVTTIGVACTTNTYAVGGTVSGLAGAGLTLALNGGSPLAASASGAFTFPTKLASGTAYGVTITAQPASPTQTCSVTTGTGTGTIAGASVTTVAVTCTTNTYAVGGTVIGLTGTGLTLANQGGDALVVAAGATSFTFKTKVASGQAYAVSISAQPGAPSQTCAVTGATGTILSGAVTSVIVDCATNSYTIGGTVSGLAGAGLVLANGAATVAISANGTFAFATPVTSGSAYDVTVKTGPLSPSQACTVAAGSGTVGGSSVTSVAVTCATNSFAIGGTVSGLSGSGLVLDDNGGNPLAVTGNGAFTFSAPLASGAGYAVTVATQPSNPWQTCAPGAASGTVGNAAVTSVVVPCTTNTYAVGGVLSGLAAGAKLSLTLNGGAPLTLAANGAFTFSTAVASGATYAVAVQTAPSAPAQTCGITSGSGTMAGAPVGNVSVVCSTNAYVVSGTISGLSGSGLVLTDNGGDALTVAAGATSFTFATGVASGSAFDVQVQTQPSGPTQQCSVSGNNGTVGSGPVTSVQVNCNTQAFTVGGTVGGLSGTGLVLANGTATATITSNGSFAFPTPVASGATYAVTVKTQPASPSQVCVVAAGSGTVTNGNVGSVQVTCTTSSFTVSGTVTGLSGSGLVLADNGSSSLPITANGAFTFAQSVASGAPYAVTVATSPTSPWQSCVVTNGKGNVGGGAVTGIQVACTTNAYTVGGTVSGLLGSGLSVTLNGAALPIGANGPFTFPSSLDSSSVYSVGISGQPSGPTQVCSVTADPSGQIQGANVTDVAITCATTSFAVSGTVVGLQGSGLTLTDNGGDTIDVAQGATSFTFPTAVPSGSGYDVEISADPGAPAQSCTATANQGTVGAGPVTGVVIDCSTDQFTVSGTVTGLAGTGLVLIDDVGDSVSVTGTAFSFTIASGTTFNVQVVQNPTGPWQTCAVTNGYGTVTNGDVTGIAVSCTTLQYTLSGTISNLAGSGLEIYDGLGDVATISGGTFSVVLNSGSSYQLVIGANPSSPTQTCTVTAGAQGTVTDANITGATVSCVTDSFSLSVNVTGLLSGDRFEVEDSQGQPLVPNTNATYTFDGTYLSGSAYSVTFLSQPGAPVQNCYVDSGNASGTVGGANIVVDINCETTNYIVGVIFYPPASTDAYTGSCTALNITDGTGTYSLTSSQMPSAGQTTDTYWFGTSYTSDSSYKITFTGYSDLPFSYCACYNQATGAYLGTSFSLSGTLSGGDYAVPVKCEEANPPT